MINGQWSTVATTVTSSACPGGALSTRRATLSGARHIGVMANSEGARRDDGHSIYTAPWTRAAWLPQSDGVGGRTASSRMGSG